MRALSFDEAGTTVAYIRSRGIIRFGSAGQPGYAEVAPAALLGRLGVDVAELVPARQYLLFAGSHARPAGGLGDLLAVYGSEVEAREGFRQARLARLAAGTDRYDWAQLAALDAAGRLRRVCWYGRPGVPPGTDGDSRTAGHGEGHGRRRHRLLRRR